MFEEIIGNDENKNILKNIIKKGNISQSYMFVGKSGIGKMLFAKEFAKALLCNAENKPCNQCDACLSLKGNNNPDITILDETEKSIKTETIKKLIKDVYEKPIKSKKKVYVINDCEKMTKEAQNSILKTLEEPPEYVVIILITENENLLLNTIKSRCIKLNFNSLSNNEIEKILTEKIGISQVSNNLLELSDGSMERAISLQGKENLYEQIKQIFTNIEKTNIIDMLGQKEEIFKNKEEIEKILDYINIIILKKVKDNQKYIKGIQLVEETKKRLRSNSNYDMTIDNLLLRLWEEVNG